jgi:hypothetical protein
MSFFSFLFGNHKEEPKQINVNEIDVISEEVISVPTPPKSTRKVKRLSQDRIILNHLLKYGSITSWEAIQVYRITRLAHQIYVLRKGGLFIKSIPMESSNNQQFVKYVLVTK